MDPLGNQQQQNSLNLKRSNKRNISETENDSISWLSKITEEKNSAEELIADIIAQVEAPPPYYKNVHEICNNLNKIMKFFYRNPGVRVEVFGSSVTKLAFKDSDVDIYLDFGESLPEPPEMLVKTLKNKVRKFGYFYNTIPIFARVPIVHCVHRSQVSCDLSFSNALGVKNSYLIKFLLSIDDRIRPLILILKFLMKIQGLLGQHALTSFAFISLVIFFLQVVENPILPSISHLQNLETERRIVADWDTSFTTEVSRLPSVINKLSVTELLQKFFEFYSTFEFGFYVISLFIAEKKLKPVFSDLNLLPDEFHLYKANVSRNESLKFDCNKVMCVQGPFNHGNNVTRSVSQKSVVQMQKLCSTYASIGQEFLGKNKSEENKLKFLKNVFNHKIDDQKNKKLKEEDIIIFVGSNLIFDHEDCTEEDLRNKWSNQVFNDLKYMLSRVMKCDIDVQSKTSDKESNSSVNYEKIIKCELHYIELLTKKRNEVKSEFEFPDNISVLKKEEIISDYLCDTVLKNVEAISLNFEINCTVKKEPTRFCMSLNSVESPVRYMHFTPQVFQFVHNNIPKWIK